MEIFNVFKVCVCVCVCAFAHQTLENAFLQLCEVSDQVGPPDSSQGPVYSNSVSPDSLRDECREPILGKDVSATSDIPKFKGDYKTLEN